MLLLKLEVIYLYGKNKASMNISEWEHHRKLTMNIIGTKNKLNLWKNKSHNSKYVKYNPSVSKNKMCSWFWVPDTTLGVENIGRKKEMLKLELLSESGSLIVAFSTLYYPSRSLFLSSHYELSTISIEIIHCAAKSLALWKKKIYINSIIA